MNTTIHTKNYHVSEKLRGIIEKKLERLQKYFDDDARCTIVCTKSGVSEKMEITINAQGHVFRAQEESKQMYNNIDGIMRKIEGQVVKNKEKLKTIIRRNAVDEKQLAFISRGETAKYIPAEIKKNKSFAIKILSDKEAELDLATLDHNFFVYADEETQGVKVMYRRPDGNVGVIEITNAVIKVDLKEIAANKASDAKDAIIKTACAAKEAVMEKASQGKDLITEGAAKIKEKFKK